MAHNVAGTIESYSYIPAMGFGLAVCTAVGVSLGEKKTDQAKQQVWSAYWLTAAVMVLIGAGVFLFAPQLAVILQFGLAGVWSAYALDITVRGLLLLLRFRKGAWEKIEL